MLFYWWRQRKLHRAFWALIAIGAVMAAVKLITVGPGWILGSNRAIWLRIFRFVAPKPINYIVTAAAPWVVLGAGIAIAVILWRRPRLALGALAAGLMASVLTYSLTIGWPAGRPGLDIAFAGVLEERGLLKTVPMAAVWLIAAWAGFRGPDRGLIALLVIAHYVLGLPPKIAPQTGTRSLYTAQLLSSAVSALCLWSVPLLFREAPDGEACDEDADSVKEV
jgi:hypothetical protein